MYGSPACNEARRMDITRTTITNWAPKPTIWLRQLLGGSTLPVNGSTTKCILSLLSTFKDNPILPTTPHGPSNAILSPDPATWLSSVPLKLWWPGTSERKSLTANGLVSEMLNSILQAGLLSIELNLLTSPGRRRAVLKSVLLEPIRKSRLSSTQFPPVSSWRSEVGTGIGAHTGTTTGTGWLSRFKDLTLNFQLPSICVAKLAVCAAISTKKSLENSWLLNVAPFPLVNSWLPASRYVIQLLTLLFDKSNGHCNCHTAQVRWKMHYPRRIVPSSKRDGNLRVDRPTISYSPTWLNYVINRTFENVWPFTTNIISESIPILIVMLCYIMPSFCSHLSKDQFLETPQIQFKSPIFVLNDWLLLLKGKY